MKGIKSIAVALMLLGSLLLMQGAAVAEDGRYEGCCMTGGGMLFGRFQTGPATYKTMIVNYGLLLSCPGPYFEPDSSAVNGPVQEEDPINLLSVVWAGSNRFVLKQLDKSYCEGANHNYAVKKGVLTFNPGFNTIGGTGTGTYNWGMPGYKIEFEFIDGKMTGLRDWAHIIIRDPSDQIVLDAEGYISAGGQATHCLFLVDPV